METTDQHKLEHRTDELSSARQLPPDLPKSLDDRRQLPGLGPTTEIYDAWQGQSQLLSGPIGSTRETSIDGASYDDDLTTKTLEDSENRLLGMLAAQAAHQGTRSGAGNEDGAAEDDRMPAQEKRDTLQKTLNMAASNGDVTRIQRLVGGQAKDYVDVDAPDEDGTAPLIYASCFGHQDAVQALLDAGADVDVQDRNRWSPLMWAMTNRHKAIAKLLLDHGASPDVKSSSGRAASDFVAPNSELSEYLQENGYRIGNVGATDDFYDTGFSQDRFEEEMAENELKRRMMMESAMNLEVDLSSLGLDERPESPDEPEPAGHEFVWDRCLNDQMFVFQESELGRILDLIITSMTPQRSPSQKPVPANILFLSARYAHYHASHELLADLLELAMEKINDVVEKHQWDMTILAFWISNATLLLYYLKKDAGLVEATTVFQLHLAELINEIFILIIRDAERRMDKYLDVALLNHETIPGFEDVHFQNEWRLFRSKTKVKEPEPIEKRYRPPSPKRRAQASPRNITSLLSSTLFVLDLYDIHSFIIAQVFAQLFYWLGAELFNRIISDRKYLARTKAMQIRMNVSTLEDWARVNNRQPEHHDGPGSKMMTTTMMTSNSSHGVTSENFVDAARRHLAPAIQLLQWLQCFSSLGEDFESLVATLQQLPRLSPYQLVRAVKSYRPEVGEMSLPKSAMKYLVSLQKETTERRLRQQKAISDSSRNNSWRDHSHHPVLDRSNPSSPSSTTKVNDTHERSQPQLPQHPPPMMTTTTTTTTPTMTTPPSAQLDHSPSTPRPPPTTTSYDMPPPTPMTPSSSTTITHPLEFHRSPSDHQYQSQQSDHLLLDPSLMLPFSLPTSTDMLVSYGSGFGGVNRERERKYIPSVPAEFLIKLDHIAGGFGEYNGGGGGHRNGGMRHSVDDHNHSQDDDDDDDDDGGGGAVDDG